MPTATETATAPMLLPQTVADALSHLALPGAIAVAGASWVMRAPLRHEPVAPVWVALNRIKALHACDTGGPMVQLGALTTHDQLVRLLPDAPDLRALVQAAGGAANPGVRRIATLGGNLCATGFAAVDLIPALLALDASVSIATPAGPEKLDMPAFLTRRTAPGPLLVTGVTIPRSTRPSAHTRLPMRKAGDYPVAIVSLSLETGPQGLITDLRLAVGAVEGTARRWTSLETRAKGTRPDPAAIAALAQQHTADFTPRSGLDAPGWYRLRVLPTLVRRAFEQIAQEVRP